MRICPRLALASPRSPQRLRSALRPFCVSRCGAANGLGFGLDSDAAARCEQRLVRAGGRDCCRPPRAHMSIVSATHADPRSRKPTAPRSRISGENLFVDVPMMLPPAREFEPPANPARFTVL